MVDNSFDEIEDVVVVGAGSMGHGIGQVFATAGYNVILVDVSENILSDALDNIERSLERLEEDSESIINRITTTTDRPQGLRDSDLMVEAVPEAIEIKEAVFKDADEFLPDHAVLATNTSSLPISEIASVTDRPEQVVGMHFSNPVPLMPIVEVIKGEKTRPDVFELAKTVSEAVGKTPVLVRKDVPGFILNRINYSFWSEALRRIDDGDFEPKTIDAAIQRLGFPMGPFEVLDFAGLDVYYMVCESMEDRGVPVEISPTHEELVQSGKYGLKTGEGFYEYPKPGEYTRIDIPLDDRYEYDPYHMIASATNASAWLLDNEVATKEDIDTAMEIGMNWPRGPLEFADEYGIDRVVNRLEELYQETGREQYNPHHLLEKMVEDGHLGAKSGKGFYEYTFSREQFGAVEYERRATRAVIRPSAGNGPGTSDSSAWDQLGAALERARRENDVRALLLKNLGDVFKSEFRLMEAKTWETVEDGTRYFEEVVLPVVERLQQHPRPVISVAERDVTGPGCELLLFSDIAVMNTGCRIALPEASAGVLPPFWLTPHIGSVHDKTIIEVAITDLAISPSEAEDAGILNHAVPHAQASDVARELARLTTASAPESISTLKRLRGELDGDFRARVGDVFTAVAELAQSDSATHGIETILNEEQPHWDEN